MVKKHEAPNLEHLLEGLQIPKTGAGVVQAPQQK